MKNLRIYCILLLNLAVMTAAAQTVPFVEEGKTWTVEYISGSFFNLKSTLEKLAMEGDTIIGGRKWKKVYCTGRGVRRLVTAMYEEAGKVYFLPYAGATEGNLIYDFSLKTGDEGIFSCTYSTRALPGKDENYKIGNGPLKVISTEKRVYGGVERTRLTLHILDEESEGYEIFWVEGIGNDYTTPLGYINPFVIGGDGYHFVDCRLDDRVLCQNDRFYSRPFVEEGKRWRVESRPAHGMPSDADAPSVFRQYVLEGDTVIGGRTWKKLYLIREETGQKTLLSALYETEDGRGRVYFLQYAGDTEGQLLYDFQPGVGDQCKCYSLGSCDYFPTKEEYKGEAIRFSISDTYVVENNCQLLQAFDAVGSPESVRGFKYLEGVGNVADPFRYYYGGAEDGAASHVVECSVRGEKLYEEELWHAPAAGIEPVRVAGGENGDGGVYDLSGRRLGGVPRSGVYIRNGRKYLVR